MPIYEFFCPYCEFSWETFCHMRDRFTIICMECGRKPERLISRPAAIRPDLAPYYDEGLGALVESRSQRKRLIEKAGVEEVGTTGKEHPHGVKGTVFSFPGKVATAATPSGYYASGKGKGNG